ncbi:hypothetical protein [Nonomuraea sp. NPDC003804]|uniref:hypothetical protein n=1 Tax=Nonomuraea sp. NPDC003804 TaxID=3154547 RepID=UPI0033BBC48F
MRARIRDADQQAFGELFNEFARAVHNHAYRPRRELFRPTALGPVLGHQRGRRLRPHGQGMQPAAAQPELVARGRAELSVFCPDQLDMSQPTFQIDPSAIKEGQTGVLAFSVNEQHPAGVPFPIHDPGH